MKLFLALCFTVFALSANAQKGRNYIDATGTVKTRVAEFIAVKNSASAALTVGEAVCLDLTDDNGIGVDYCAVAGYKPLCVIKDTSCAVGAMCKCQTKGYFSNAAWAKVGGKNATAGQQVYASVDGSLYSIGDATASSHAHKFPVGTALDAASAAGDLEIYIDL